MARNPSIQDPKLETCVLTSGTKGEGTNETPFGILAEGLSGKNYRAQFSASNLYVTAPRKGDFDKDNEVTVMQIWKEDDPYTTDYVVPFFQALTDRFNNGFTDQQKKQLKLRMPPKEIWEEKDPKKKKALIPTIKWDECPCWEIRNPLYHNEEKRTYSIFTHYNLHELKINENVTIKKTHIRHITGAMLEPQALFDKRTSFDGTATGMSFELTGKYNNDNGFTKMRIKVLSGGFVAKKLYESSGDDDSYYIEQMRLEQGEQEIDDQSDLLASLMSSGGSSAPTPSGGVPVTSDDINSNGNDAQSLAEAYGAGGDSPKAPSNTLVVKQAALTKK